MKRFILIILLFLPVILRAQEAKEPETYTVSIGDQLNIYVYPGEEFSKVVTVGDDGRITMPIIGSLYVVGLKVKELTDKLTNEIKRYVANPKVTITITKFGPPREIYLTGEVARPGTYPYREDLKLLELISRAGGLTDRAVIDNIKITRGPERNVITTDMRKDVKLEPGDIIEVPRAEPVPPVQILGEIRTPGSYIYRKNMKLVEAITMAGGFTGTADLRNVRVHRGGSKPHTIRVNMNEILIKGQVQKDITLQGGDVVYIPRTGIAWWNWFITNVVPTLTLISAVILLYRTI